MCFLTPSGALVAFLRHWFPGWLALLHLWGALTFPCVCSGGVQEAEAVLCDLRGAGRGVAVLWPRAAVRELLRLHRVPAVLWTDRGAAALLTSHLASQPAGTTTDSRPVSPDSTDASLWSRQLLQVISPQHEHWSGFIFSRWCLLNHWPVLCKVMKWKLVLWNLGYMIFSVLPVEHQYIWLIIALDQQHCSHEEYFKTYSWLLSNATINHIRTNHILICVEV